LPSVKLETNCPECHARISVDVGVGIADGPSRIDKEREWLGMLSPSNREVLELAEQNGLLEAFRQARDAVHPLKKGKSQIAGYRFFLTWLLEASEMELDNLTQLAAQELFKTCAGQVKALIFNRIIGVLVDDRLQLFIPDALIKRAPAVPQNGKVKIADIAAQTEPFRNWVKTKNGYVPAKASLFLQEMRRRVFGEFGRPMQ